MVLINYCKTGIEAKWVLLHLQVSGPSAVPVPVGSGRLKQLPSPTKRGGAQSSTRHSRRDHHSPHYQHSVNPYHQQQIQQRYESVSSSKRHKRRHRPRSGSPYHQGSNADHHRPRPRPHSTPNTVYS